MGDIRTKQFQILTDTDPVWRLMTDVYSRGQSGGPAAPFFEYAITSSWLDKDYLRLDRLWLDGDVPVAFVFYENPVTAIYFVLRAGYEQLAGEMVGYAGSAFPDFGEPQELVLLGGQTALIEAAEAQGYLPLYEETDCLFDFRKGRLDHPLPAGYRFVDPRSADPLKIAKCMWDGFNSEELGEFRGWDDPGQKDGWTPHKLYQSVLGGTIAPSPHATYDLNVIIADENGDYVCFSGMWWVPENRLAYMEPLCTVPGHRRRGLAAAALSRHDSVLRPLGAEIMTGGGSGFYRSIGYNDTLVYKHFGKQR